jgi:hypothetical protein
MIFTTMDENYLGLVKTCVQQDDHPVGQAERFYWKWYLF